MFGRLNVLLEIVSIVFIGTWGVRIVRRKREVWTGEDTKKRCPKMNNVFLRHVTILFLNSYSVCAVKFFEVIVCDHVFVDVALNGFMLYLRIGYDADLFVVYFLVQCVVGFVWLDDFEKGCVLDQQAHAVLVALTDVRDEL